MITATKAHIFYSKKNKEIIHLHLNHKQNKILLCVKIRKKDFIELIQNNNYEVSKLNETTIYTFV